MEAGPDRPVWRSLLMVGAAGALATALLIFALDEAGAALGPLLAGAGAAALLRRRGRGWGRSIITGLAVAVAVLLVALVAIFAFAVAICFSDLDRCFPS